MTTSDGICRKCHRAAVLGNGLCVKCWDAKSEKGQYCISKLGETMKAYISIDDEWFYQTTIISKEDDPDMYKDEDDLTEIPDELYHRYFRIIEELEAVQMELVKYKSGEERQ